MNKVKLIVVAFLCVAILCVSAMAQPSSTPPPLPEELRATAEQIATLIDVMHVREQMVTLRDLMPAMVQKQMQKQREALSGGQFSPKQWENIEEFLKPRIENLYPVEEIIADIGKVYQKYISSKDADVLIEFYRTPAVQRMINVQPSITREYLPLVLSRMETHVKVFSEENVRDAQKLLKELLENQ